MLDHQLGVGQMGFDAARQQVEIVGDGFQRIVDLVREADRDFAGRRELLAMAHQADVAGEADRAGRGAVLLVDDRARDRDRDQLAVLAAEHGLEVRDAPRILAGGAHRLHHAARFLQRRVNGGDLLADDFFGGVVQVFARSVVVEDDRAATVDRDDDVGGAFDQTLEIIMIQ